MKTATAAPIAVRTWLGCVAALCGIVLLLAGPTWAAAPEKSAGEQAKPKDETVTKDDIKALAADYLERGAAARDAGKLELARTLLRSALRFEPDNAAARSLLEQVEKAMGVTDADRMREKLQARIPEVQFEDAEIKEVVDFLAKKADLNIVFDPAALSLLASQAGAQTGEAGPDAGDVVLEPGAAETAPSQASRPGTRITLHLKNVPLKEILRYVLRYKNLRYIVEDYALLIVPIGWQRSEEMVTEEFRLTTPGTGAGRMINEMTGGGSAWGTNNQ